HIDQLGLRTALVAMVEKVAASSTVRIEADIGDVDGLLGPGDDITLYRIVQEGLNNILKHSGATRAEVEVVVDERLLTLTIRDDGRGFAAEGGGAPGAGLGLHGIAERARILGGTCRIASAPG